MPECDYLVPQHDYYITHHKPVECLLEKNHDGDHLCRVHDGSYILWLPDDKCKCVELDCGCFTYEVTSRDNAEMLLGKTVR